MQNPLDEKILSMIQNSAIDDSSKELITMSLSSLSEDQKATVLNDLTEEQRGIQVLGAKEKQMVQKYDIVMGKCHR